MTDLYYYLSQSTRLFLEIDRTFHTNQGLATCCKIRWSSGGCAEMKARAVGEWMEIEEDSKRLR